MFFASAQEAAAKRVALVIGNDVYQHLPRLPKAVTDAQAIGETMRRLGFEVVLAENLDNAGFVRSLDRFRRLIDPGDEVVFHFAGHGVTYNRRTYLLPVDMEDPGRNTRKLPAAAGDVERTIEALLDRDPRYVMAILDTCRENPFTASRRGRSPFARRHTHPPIELTGGFILHAAGSDEAALDSLGAHDGTPTSVFTRVLLNHLETPGLSVQQVARRTMTEVRDLAKAVGHEQFPAYTDRLSQEFILKPASGRPIEIPTAATGTPLPSERRLTGVAGTSMSFRLQPPVDSGGMLIVEGLPRKARLGAGEEIAPGRWRVPGPKLQGLSLQTPPNAFGPYEVTVLAEQVDGANRPLATVWLVLSAPSVVNVEPVSTQDREATDPLRLKRPESTSLTIRELDELLARGIRLFDLGDVTSARLLFHRVAEAGEPMGLLLSGTTFDPLEYHRRVLAGLQPDPRRAMEYYYLARGAGVPEAGGRIRSLEQHIATH